ncbi:MAG: hypothetical protein A2Y62_20155 [Candidatus Fischerbacteria bacterium RBG_13_37_8]|uniref:Uncharacterized protein n=1 Tax=Candidatus Fischerbacteria bacterium RBG_13_37_8 TaxID=1817863 RepID=A0A1F5V5F9_9BACT|nr:MAG: hypothetical protein A2Y62_20155 [Candidatus Fischerbacteria bacterium RBG_13_37_8]
MKQKIAYYLIIISSFCISAFIIFFIMLILPITDIIPFMYNRFTWMIYILLATFIPLLTGIKLSLFFSSYYKKKKNLLLEPFWKNKTCAIIVIILFFVTWLIGVPAVYNSQSKWAIEEFNTRINKSKLPAYTIYPTVKTYIAFPVLPFIIVSYHEYVIAPLYGQGGWYIHFWYIKDVVKICEIGLWIS